MATSLASAADVAPPDTLYALWNARIVVAVFTTRAAADEYLCARQRAGAARAKQIGRALTPNESAGYLLDTLVVAYRA